MQKKIAKSVVLPSIMFPSLLAKDRKPDWRAKPADWSDIRKDCPADSIALYAAHSADYSQYDNLGFTATCTGGYNVFIDEKKYGTFTSGSRCNITWSNTFIDKDLPIGYRRITGFSTNNDCYYQITNFRLTGADTIKFSFEFAGTSCNVLGSYTTSSAEDNLSLYVGTSASTKYLRYDGGTSSSYCKADTRYDVQITPTGSIGFETPSTWEQKTFTCPIDFFVGTTGVSATTSKFIGTFYGNIEVVGRLNLIPCERENDNTICLYDTYSQTFYEPIGTNPTSLGYDNSYLINGDDITTPTALKAHKIWIEPATSGNNITAFKMDTSSREGLLWLHSNIDTAFTSLATLVGATSGSCLIKAVTAKNNVLKSQQMGQAFGKCPYLEYLPVLDFDNSDKSIAYICYNPTSDALKKITIRNLKQVGNVSNSDAFNNNQGLKKIILKNSSLCWYQNTFRQNLYSLEELPKGLYNAPGSIEFRNAKTLKPTDLDFRDRTQATYIKVYGDATNPMYGVKSVRVSNQAPFNDTTAPQINISYTGLDRSALVQLFNDLPYNVGYTAYNTATISDNIVSFGGPTGYLRLASFPAVSANWEITLKATTTYYSDQNQQRLISIDGAAFLVRTQPGYLKWQLYLTGQEVYLDGSVSDYPYLKLIKIDSTISVYMSTDGVNWELKKENISIGNINDGIINLGASSLSWRGTLDLNETYIKVNGVYWFRGQPAMTKTLSCVGATGTADLTADDKDIALAKGWSLTLS